MKVESLPYLVSYLVSLAKLSERTTNLYNPDMQNQVPTYVTIDATLVKGRYNPMTMLPAVTDDKTNVVMVDDTALMPSRYHLMLVCTVKNKYCEDLMLGIRGYDKFCTGLAITPRFIKQLRCCGADTWNDEDISVVYEPFQVRADSITYGDGATNDKAYHGLRHSVFPKCRLFGNYKTGCLCDTMYDNREFTHLYEVLTTLNYSYQAWMKYLGLLTTETGTEFGPVKLNIPPILIVV